MAHIVDRHYKYEAALAHPLYDKAFECDECGFRPLILDDGKCPRCGSERVKEPVIVQGPDGAIWHNGVLSDSEVKKRFL